MNRYDQEPTEENIRKSLIYDTFGRNHYIEKFYELLMYADGLGSIAVDGEWGTGKTFFAKQLLTVINLYNSSVDNKKNKDIQNKLNLKDEDIDKSMKAVYYDSWKNDNDTDPLISILYEMTKQLDLDLEFDPTREEKSGKLLALIGLISEKLKNKTDCFTELIAQNKKISEIENERNIDKVISEFVLNIQKEKCNKLIVFIDELDRCNPLYAVKLLERIKHYLINENIIFVFMINSKELQYSIQQCYGKEFDAYRYLDRFFSLRLQLPKINYDKLYNQIHLYNYESNEIIKSVIDYYGMTVREIMHYKVLCDIIQNRFRKRSNQFVFQYDQIEILLSQYLAPLLLGIYINDIENYYEVISGSDSKLFADIFDSLTINNEISRGLLDSKSESYEDYKDRKKVTLKQKSVELYNDIFGPFRNFNDIKTIGIYKISKDTKNELLEIVSLLSDISDFID